MRHLEDVSGRVIANMCNVSGSNVGLLLNIGAGFAIERGRSA